MNASLCSGGAQPVPLPVLREPVAEKADGGGGEGAEPAQLRQGAEATQGAIQSATTRFDAHPLYSLNMKAQFWILIS